jgi:DNA polymerase IV
MRKIIHIDMDCFYAAIEMRDNHLLRHLPIAVGGLAHQRGVISTCNYKAREFGVHSAMPTSYAIRLCPNLNVIPVSMEKYKKVSQQIREIFAKYTNLVEPLSLDEAYLDVSKATHCHGSATLIAKKIREEIFCKTQLTASAGIAPNKCLAKIASDWNKPNGQFVITPVEISPFMQHLSVRKIPGVGKVTENKFRQLGITTCRQLQYYSHNKLIEKFGSFGFRLYHLCRGIDDREIISNRKRKSLSIEQTYSHDLLSLSDCYGELPELVSQLMSRLSKLNKIQLIQKQFVKIKFSDFTQIGAERKIIRFNEAIYEQLIEQAYTKKSAPVRLIGLGVKFNSNEKDNQLNLDF